MAAPTQYMPPRAEDAGKNVSQLLWNMITDKYDIPVAFPCHACKVESACYGLDFGNGTQEWFCSPCWQRRSK